MTEDEEGDGEARELETRMGEARESDPLGDDCGCVYWGHGRRENFFFKRNRKREGRPEALEKTEEAETRSSREHHARRATDHWRPHNKELRQNKRLQKSESGQDEEKEKREEKEKEKGQTKQKKKFGI